MYLAIPLFGVCAKEVSTYVRGDVAAQTFTVEMKPCSQPQMSSGRTFVEQILEGPCDAV